MEFPSAEMRKAVGGLSVFARHLDKRRTLWTEKGTRGLRQGNAFHLSNCRAGSLYTVMGIQQEEFGLGDTKFETKLGIYIMPRGQLEINVWSLYLKP